MTSTTDHVELPEPFASIPRHQLLFPAPSPMHPLPRLSSSLGNKINLYAKREDLNSPIGFGGNKTRKLEYLIAEAVEKQADVLVSIGGVQSNHTRQVAGVAGVLGLKCHLVQEHWVPHPPLETKEYESVGNIQLSRLFGANVHLDPSTFGIEHRNSLKSLFAELQSRGEKPYYIPAGASDHPLGGLGFARWAFEVAQQEKLLGVFFDVVVVCAVTGSTFAGMIAGFKLQEKLGARTRRVLGIDASANPAATRDQVLKIAKLTAGAIGLSEDEITEEDVELNERFHDGIYGLASNETWDAIRWGMRVDGFITDPVYEGKSLRAVKEMTETGELKGNVLYVHLGGQIALNAYAGWEDGAALEAAFSKD